MAKYYGTIGFSKTIEKVPGVWSEEIIERRYKGQVIRNARRWETAETLNDNIKINNAISIMADSYLFNNIYAIKYVTWMNTRWKITDIEIERPHLKLTLGGLYNGPSS